MGAEVVSLTIIPTYGQTAPRKMIGLTLHIGLEDCFGSQPG